MITGRLIDSFDALMLKGLTGTEISVHTSDGMIGRIVGTSVVRGEVTIRLSTGREVKYPGRKVADLDTPLVSVSIR